MNVGVFMAFVAITHTLSNAKPSRRKRAYEDNFKALINLYKMNPLKHSNVFKSFSNRILLLSPSGYDLNHNTNESVEKKSIASPDTKGTTDPNPTQPINENIPEFYHENFDKSDPNRIQEVEIINKNIPEFDHDNFDKRDPNRIQEVETISKNVLEYYHRNFVKNPNVIKEIEIIKNTPEFYYENIKKKDPNRIPEVESINKNILDFYHDNYVDKHDPNYRIHITTERIQSKYANIITNNKECVKVYNMADMTKFVDAEVVIL